MDEKKLNESSLEAAFKALRSRQPKRQRGVTEVCVDLLKIATKHPMITKCRLSQYGYLRSSLGRPLLDRLIERGLLCEEERAGDRVIIVTGKGREWLQKAQEALTAVA